MTTPTDDEYRSIAGALGGMIRLMDGVGVTDAEVEDALRACTTHAHESEGGVCEVVRLVHRKADEEGIELGGAWARPLEGGAP